MKNDRYHIPYSLLTNHWCRELITTLSEIGPNNKVDIFITFFPSSSKLEQRGNILVIDPRTYAEYLLDLLTEWNAIKVYKTYTTKSKSDYDLVLRGEVEIIDRAIFRNACLIYSDSLVEEQYGLDKQIRLFKEVLKTQFLELENEELLIKLEYFSRIDRHHLNILKTVYNLIDQDYVELITLKYNFRVRKYIEFEGLDRDVIYGNPIEILKVRVKPKLLAEWVGPDLVRRQSVFFNSKLGTLSVLGTDYEFCRPDSIEGQVMEILVKNLNEKISHKQLAMITWGYSDPRRLEEKYIEDGKSFVNKRNKARIVDLKKKLKKHGLEKLLCIQADNGYKLQYFPLEPQVSTESTIEILRELEPF